MEDVPNLMEQINIIDQVEAVFDDHLQEVKELKQIKKEIGYNVRIIRQLESERAGLRADRDKKNELVKKSFTNASENREKRDEINVSVKENKAERDALNEQIKQITDTLKSEEDQNLEKQVRSLRKDSMKIHFRMINESKKSQEFHNNMLENLETGRHERKLADDLHKQVIEKTKEIREIRTKIKQLQKQRK